MTILHCSANMTKNAKWLIHKACLEIIWNGMFSFKLQQLSIKWKVNLGNFPVDSETGTSCIDIKIFKLSAQLNFERFDVNFTVFIQMSHAKSEIAKETSGTSMEHFGNASHNHIKKLMDKSKNKNTTEATALWMSVYQT